MIRKSIHQADVGNGGSGEGMADDTKLRWVHIDAYTHCQENEDEIMHIHLGYGCPSDDTELKK